MKERLGAVGMVLDDVVAQFVDIEKAHLAERALMNVNTEIGHDMKQPRTRTTGQRPLSTVPGCDGRPY